ncbi:MAG: hypothetical protein QHH02_05730 [Syntrophomonadaceae bacterium]|nr:hypothetical protein [Syntrophomonadaceae bacterium]
MLIVSSFEHSAFFELAISELEKRGIPAEQVWAIPLDQRAEEGRLFDTIHRADGISRFDGAAVLATLFMLLGVIYGFVLHWGPIIWGAIGLAGGGVLGFLIDRCFGRVRKRAGPPGKGERRREDAKGAEVVLIVQCAPPQAETVERVLWENFALGVGKMGQ